MSFFDSFKSRKNQPNTVEIRHINLSSRGIEVDGELLDVPVHIFAAKRLLGKPRAERFRTGQYAKQVLERRFGKGTVKRRVNYAWDKLGIYCYTLDGKVINTFGIRLSTEGKYYRQYPISVFKGTLTIEGKPWTEVIKDAADKVTCCHYHAGGYFIKIDYNELREKSKTREKKDYVRVEFGLP